MVKASARKILPFPLSPRGPAPVRRPSEPKPAEVVPATTGECIALELARLRKENERQREELERLRQDLGTWAYPRFERKEYASYGVDDALTLVGGDVEGGSYATGLRVPDLAGVRYLFLLAVVDLAPGDRLVGFRQLLTIGTRLQGAAPTPYYPVEQDVTSSTWHPIDGFATWQMTRTATSNRTLQTGPNDQDSFVFGDAASPALLYQTATVPLAGPLPFYLSLTAYTPPGRIGVPFFTCRDVRTGPWGQGAFWPMKYEATGWERIRFYCALLQTRPQGNGAAGRFNPNFGASATTPGALRPEDQAIAQYPTTERYHRVGGSLVVDRRLASRVERRGGPACWIP